MEVYSTPQKKSAWIIPALVALIALCGFAKMIFMHKPAYIEFANVFIFGGTAVNDFITNSSKYKYLKTILISFGILLLVFGFVFMFQNGH